MGKADKVIETKTFQGLRKMYHVLASSLFPLAYLYQPFGLSLPEVKKWLLIVSGSCFLISFMFDFLRLRDHKFNSQFMKVFSAFIRRTETNRYNGSSFLCFAFFIVILLFSRYIAITAMLFLSLGDAAAELGGKNFGRLKIFQRSMEGTTAFFVVAFLIAYAFFEDWRIAVLGAFAGAMVELFSFEVDDNLTVPIGSAVALCLVLVLFHLGNNLFSF
jgi:acyl phosphate:glycerol-3-phosphate acyltransferase